MFAFCSILFLQGVLWLLFIVWSASLSITEPGRLVGWLSKKTLKLTNQLATGVSWTFKAPWLLSPASLCSFLIASGVQMFYISACQVHYNVQMSSNTSVHTCTSVQHLKYTCSTVVFYVHFVHYMKYMHFMQTDGGDRNPIRKCHFLSRCPRCLAMGPA